jgi:hypothetical protein
VGVPAEELLDESALTFGLRGWCHAYVSWFRGWPGIDMSYMVKRDRRDFKR